MPCCPLCEDDVEKCRCTAPGFTTRYEAEFFRVMKSQIQVGHCLDCGQTLVRGDGFHMVYDNTVFKGRRCMPCVDAAQPGPGYVCQDPDLVAMGRNAYCPHCGSAVGTCNCTVDLFYDDDDEDLDPEPDCHCKKPWNFGHEKGCAWKKWKDKQK